jgi:hypothetical protein
MIRQFFSKFSRTVAPRTVENLIFLSRTRSRGSDVIELLRAYEDELQDLKTELNEIRRDQRRMAELYDLVFERARADCDK